MHNWLCEFMNVNSKKMYQDAKPYSFPAPLLISLVVLINQGTLSALITLILSHQHFQHPYFPHRRIQGPRRLTDDSNALGKTCNNIRFVAFAQISKGKAFPLRARTTC